MEKTQANISNNQQTERAAGVGSEWVISALAVVGIAIIIAIAGIAVFNARDPLAGLSAPPVEVHEETANHASSAHMDAGPGQNATQSESTEKQQQHDHMQFVAQLNDRLDKNPKDHEAMFMLANTYMMIRDFDKAESLYQRVLELEPAQIDARSNLALIAVQKKKYNDSVTLLKANLKQNPGHGESIYNLGFIYAEYLNEREKAIALWKPWLNDHPEHPVSQRLKPLYQQLVGLANK